MSPEFKDLAKRVIKCPHWEWMPGMKALRENNFGELIETRFIENHRVELNSLDDCANQKIGSAYPNMYSWNNLPGFLPDLSDPATMGCLLHLVRKAWKCEDLSTELASRAVLHKPGWCLEFEGTEERPSRAWYGASEAEVLVLALEHLK